MILDTCDHMGTYRALPGMEKIIAYLAEHDMASMPEGTYEIDGQNLYVMVQNPTLKDPKGAEPEAHKLYADLQLVLSGSEYMGYAPLAFLGDPVRDPEGKDIAFYRGPFTSLRVPAGSFAVFFPEDAHAPSLLGEGTGEKDKKAVFKIRL